MESQIQKPEKGHTGKAVTVIEEEFAIVSLTAIELKYLISRATTMEKLQMQSTQETVVNKISTATGWKMKPIQLFCRFVYRHGICKL